MAVTPTAPLSLAMDSLRTLISESATFRTWVNKATPALAKADIHLVGLPDPAKSSGYELDEIQDLRPFALLGFPAAGGGLTASRIGDGTQLTFNESGLLMMAFVDNIDPADSHEDAAFKFLNNVGGTFNDMVALAGSNGFLWASTLEMVEVWRSDPDDRSTMGDFYWASINVSWGIG